VSGDALAGRELLGQGREAEVYAWDDDLVLRLFRTSERARDLEREATAMRTAVACGVPAPRVEGSITVDGRPGLLIERVDGPDVISLFGRRPWLVPRLIHKVAMLQAQMHDTVVPAELEPLRARIRERINRIPETILPKELAQLALAALEDLPDGDRLLHGDFHPGNVLLGRGGLRIIDWTAATRGDPAADLARTCLMLTVGEAEPTMPVIVRRLDHTGRSVIVRSYLRAYRRRRPVDDDLTKRWYPVRAAERLSEGITGEYDKLRAVLRDELERAD